MRIFLAGASAFGAMIALRSRMGRLFAYRTAIFVAVLSLSSCVYESELHLRVGGSYSVGEQFDIVLGSYAINSGGYYYDELPKDWSLTFSAPELITCAEPKPYCKLSVVEYAWCVRCTAKASGITEVSLSGGGQEAQTATLVIR